MIDIQALAQVAGGIGLCLLGLVLATEGAQMAGGGVLARMVATGGGRAPGFRIGLALGLGLPRASARARAIIGLVGGGFVHLGPALRAGLGAGVGLPVLALFLAWATLTTGAAGAAALLVAAGVVGIRHGAGRVALGAGLVALGALMSEAGFGAAGLHLDALSLGLSARLFVLFTAGAACAALRGAGVVSIVALTAAAGGALELASGAALLAGAHGGAGLATLPTLWRSRGDGARAALGLATLHALGGALGLVLVRVSLPWITAQSIDRFEPALLLAGFQLVLWGAWALAWLPLAGLLREALEERIEPREGTRAIDAGIPALAVANVEARLARAASLVQLGARRQLTGDGASDFRLTSAQEEAARLSFEVDELLPPLAQRALPAELARRLTGATRRARVSEELLAALVELRAHAEAEDAGLGSLLARVRQAQAAALHLLESSRAAEPAALEGERQGLARHIDDLAQHVLSEAIQQRVHPLMARAVHARLELLGGVARLAVESGVLARRACPREVPTAAGARAEPEPTPALAA